jgi:DNA-binding MarR family transcriptional regulator
MADSRVVHQTKSLILLNPKMPESMTTQVVAGLEKIGLVMKSRTWRREGRSGLGPLQRQVLAVLQSQPQHLAQVSQIAQELAVRLPTASEAVATLERKRLVRRRRSKSDGRVVTVELSAKGLRACEGSPNKPGALVSATATLSTREQASMLTALIKLIRALQDQGEISVARMCVSCRYFQPNRYDDPAQPHHCDYVNAPLGDGTLRLNCREYEAAPKGQADAAWVAFSSSRIA